MTTNRTAIRRWLAVGGTAHRPPFGTVKARHRSIVAPLAATLAATAAVGLGVVLARAGNERRSARRARRERRLGLRTDERLAAGLRRMAITQAEYAIEELEAATPARMRKTVHETRKAIKRLRTIVRLLEGELGAEVCGREQQTLRAAADQLAAARDAEVMLATFEQLLRRQPDALAGKRQVKRLQAHLAAERDRAERAATEPTRLIATADGLRAFRARAGAWHLSERSAVGSVEDGLRRIYRQGRRRRRRAARGKTARIRVMHQWRKRVKDLRYAAEALERRELSRSGSRSGRERARAEARWLRRLGERADQLGELLGEEHDLAVLGQWLEAEGKRRGLSRKTGRKLERVIARRRVELRRRALRQGRRLYRQSPGQFMGRLGRALERSAPKLS